MREKNVRLTNANSAGIDAQLVVQFQREALINVIIAEAVNTESYIW
jgi:hypothetical protein